MKTRIWRWRSHGANFANVAHSVPAHGWPLNRSGGPSGSAIRQRRDARRSMDGDAARVVVLHGVAEAETDRRELNVAGLPHE
jgi:hypothetical protein